MYSLVSAPVLGFDLARLQGGSAVAALLLRGLTLTTSDIEVVASAWVTDWDRLDLWRDVEAAAQQRQALREQSAIAAENAADPTAELAGALTVIERCPLGTIDGLLHCVRYDVLDWTWPAIRGARTKHPRAGRGGEQTEPARRATSVICDAVAAAYLRDLLPEQTRQRLAAPWVGVSRALPERVTDLGPQHAAVIEVLGRVGSLPADDRVRLVRAAEKARHALAEWAPAVHSASWAVFLSGRVRAAAAAQLLLVQAIERGGVSITDRAGGVWNLLSGAIQALVARDLLDNTTVHRLVDPYLAALGPLAGPLTSL